MVEMIRLLGQLKLTIHSQQVRMQDLNRIELSWIRDDPYKASFYNTLTRDLNSTYVAATVINVKAGSLGHLGNVIEVLGDFVPAFGGAVQFFGTILAVVNGTAQTRFVRKFAELVSSVGEMEEISRSVAEILSGDSFDKGLLDSEVSTMERIMSHLTSFVDFIDCGKNVATTEQALNKPSQSILSNFKKLFKKVNVNTSEMKQVEPEHSSHQAHKEQVDQAESHVNIISSVIVTAIFQGKFSFDYSSSPKQVAKLMITFVSKLFEQQVASLSDQGPFVNFSVSYLQENASPVSKMNVAKAKSKAIAEEILFRAKLDVTVNPKYDDVFISDMSQKLKSTKTSTGNKLIDSLISSDDLKHHYVKVLSHKFVAKLSDSAIMSSISPHALHAIFRETEEEIRNIEDSICRNDDGGDLSVW